MCTVLIVYLQTRKKSLFHVTYAPNLLQEGEHILLFEHD